MLHQLEFKHQVEMQYKKGIDKMAKLYQADGDKKSKADAESKRVESDKKIQLLLNEQGEVYHVGFKTSDWPTSAKGGSKKDEMSVEVVPMQPASTIQLNKPVVLNADGKLAGQPEEKTFLQKYVQIRSLVAIHDDADSINRYWWAIGLFLVVPGAAIRGIIVNEF